LEIPLTVSSNSESLQVIFKQNNKENMIISPVSIKLLLTALAESAGQDTKSETREELKKVLPYNRTLEDARDYYATILKSLQVNGEIRFQRVRF
jgi:serine protease inhibitor